MELLNNIVDYSTTLLQNGGFIFGFILILIEAFIPILPLGVFITLNINAFEFLFGFMLSWFSTVIGSYIAFLLFYYLSEKYISKILRRFKIKKIITKIKKINFSNLVILISLPFTPSFAINIAGGVSRISKKKYLLSLIIGKFFTVMFWALIGKSIIDSITNIKTIIILGIFILIAFIISKIVSKKMNIE